MPTMGLAERVTGQRAVEDGVAEAEDPAVGAHQPVAFAA